MRFCRMAVVPLSGLAVTLAMPAAVHADRLPLHAEKVVEYRIDVRLDPATKQLRGRQRLTWWNPSSDAVSDLWFHLYLNAFKNSASTFYRESGGRLRSDEMPEDGWGWIDVKSMKLADGRDLTPGFSFQAPDDGNREDQTVLHVPLPSPIPPDGSVTVDIEFTAQLPRVFARTGHAPGDFFLVGQWYPKLGVYEPAGTRGRTAGGWNCHQFHANSEFYADYGRFEVDITVPSRFVIGATGERKATKKNPDGTTTYTYVQDDVHDFAWTVDPDYVEVKARFSAKNDVSEEEYERVAKMLRRSVDEVRLSDVDITVLVHPPHQPQADRYVRAAKAGLKFFGLWYGRYPYKTLTVVDPAPGGNGAGGMEYPTFITGGTSHVLNYWGGVLAPEGVTVHEFGHQYWYGLVGNNEFEEAWLDEGINTYSTSKVMQQAFGAMLQVPGILLGPNDDARLSNSPERKFDRIRQPAWTYQGGSYGFYSYQKPQLSLHTLERHLGEELMARVMRTFHERWRFAHPSSDDFYRVANEVAGQDLSWFFTQAIESDRVLDYEVASVTSRPAVEAQGYFVADGGRKLVKQSEARERQKDAERAGQPVIQESIVVVRRRGEFVFPVDIAVKFEGKPVERVYWDGRDRWKRLIFMRPERLEWAEVDPDHKLVLDVDWLNNSMRVDADGRAATVWSARWMFLLQQLLAVVGW